MVVEQAMFRTPFLGPSSCYGGKQGCPKEGCLVTQGLQNFPAVPNQGRATIWPQSPVCRFATISPSEFHTCYLAAPPSPQDLRGVSGGVAMTCAELGLKLAKLAQHQPHSLVPVSPTQGQHEVETTGDPPRMQGLPERGALRRLST